MEFVVYCDRTNILCVCIKLIIILTLSLQLNIISVCFLQIETIYRYIMPAWKKLFVDKKL